MPKFEAKTRAGINAFRHTFPALCPANILVWDSELVVETVVSR